MTTPPDTAQRVAGEFAWRLGQVSTAVLGIVLVAWALTVDFSKSIPGFFGDASTYYSLGHSLAEDFDFEFRREDLVRVWREFPSGPEGIFLKRGRDVRGVQFSSTPPFFEISSAPDPEAERLYYAKGFIYPLFAAPFVWLFGTNGFLVLHAVLMTLSFACAYGFLVARSSPIASLVFAAAFLLISVAPVYMVWLTPDFFNLAVVLVGYFFWAYKEVLAESTTACIGRWREAWVITPRSDIVAAVLLGIATFSKPTNILLIGPVLVLLAWRRQWRRAFTTSAVFGAVVGGLFALNVAITGEWNYQGGEDRGTFYSMDPDGPGPRIGGFPFQTAQHSFDTTGMIRETNRVPVEVLATGDALLQVFPRNVAYFFFGRHTGFVPYFFPGAVAILLFLLVARQRPLWQWLTLAAGLGSAMALILYMPVLVFRRRRPGRQPLLPRRIPGLPVRGATVDGSDGPHRGRSGRCHLHGAARHQSVHRVFPTGGACEKRTVSLAAGGDDAAQRSADERDAAEGQAATGRGAAGVGLLP